MEQLKEFFINLVVNNWLELSPILLVLILRLVPTKKNLDFLTILIKWVFKFLDKRIPNIKKGGGKHIISILVLVSLFSLPIQAQLNCNCKTVKADVIEGRTASGLLIDDPDNTYISNYDTTLRDWTGKVAQDSVVIDTTSTVATKYDIDTVDSKIKSTLNLNPNAITFFDGDDFNSSPTFQIDTGGNSGYFSDGVNSTSITDNDAMMQLRSNVLKFRVINPADSTESTLSLSSSSVSFTGGDNGVSSTDWQGRLLVNKIVKAFIFYSKNTITNKIYSTRIDTNKFSLDYDGNLLFEATNDSAYFLRQTTFANGIKFGDGTTQSTSTISQGSSGDVQFSNGSNGFYNSDDLASGSFFQWDGTNMLIGDASGVSQFEIDFTDYSTGYLNFHVDDGVSNDFDMNFDYDGFIIEANGTNSYYMAVTDSGIYTPDTVSTGKGVKFPDGSFQTTAANLSMSDTTSTLATKYDLDTTYSALGGGTPTYFFGAFQDSAYDVFNTVDVYEKVTNADNDLITSISSNNITFAGDTITIITSGLYEITANINVNSVCALADAALARGAIFVNNVAQTPCAVVEEHPIASGAGGSILSLKIIKSLSANDNISLKVRLDDTGSTCHYLYLFGTSWIVKKID